MVDTPELPQVRLRRTDKPFPIQQLPDDVLLMIFKHLVFQERKDICLVCKRWCRLVRRTFRCGIITERVLWPISEPVFRSMRPSDAELAALRKDSSSSQLNGQTGTTATTTTPTPPAGHGATANGGTAYVVVPGVGRDRGAGTGREGHPRHVRKESSGTTLVPAVPAPTDFDPNVVTTSGRFRIRTVSYHSQREEVDAINNLSHYLELFSGLDQLKFKRLVAVGLRSALRALKNNQSVRSVVLTGNSLDPLSLEALVSVIQENTVLERLVLARTQLTNEQLAPIILALEKNKVVTSVNLSGNRLRKEEAKSVSQVISIPPLVTLVCSGCRLGDSGAGVLGEALTSRLTTLSTLILSRNEICDGGLFGLAEALKTNTSLRKLDLSNNSIGNLGMKYLGSALKVNTSLLNINLASNHIGNFGVACLVSALKVNRTLLTVDLTSNHTGKFHAGTEDVDDEACPEEVKWEDLLDQLWECLESNQSIAKTKQEEREEAERERCRSVSTVV